MSFLMNGKLLNQDEAFFLIAAAFGDSEADRVLAEVTAGSTITLSVFCRPLTFSDGGDSYRNVTFSNVVEPSA